MVRILFLDSLTIVYENVNCMRINDLLKNVKSIEKFLNYSESKNENNTLY